MEASFVLNSQISGLKQKWFMKTESYVTAQPLVSADRVYCTDWAGYAYCLNVNSGDVIWKVKLYTPPSPKDSLIGRIIGATLPYTWYGLVGTGVIKDNIWYVASAGGKTGKPLENGEPGKIYALNILSGKVLWQKSLASEPYSGSLATLLAADNNIYSGVCSVEEGLQVSSILYFKKYKPQSVGMVMAFDPLTGDCRWSTKIIGLSIGDDLNAKGNGVWGGFAVDEELHTIYFATGNNYGKPSSKSSDAIICLDSRTGAYRWQYQVETNDTWLPLFSPGGDTDFGCTPQLFDINKNGETIKSVGIGNKNGYYYTFNRENGAMLWKTLCHVNSETEEGIRSNACIANGRIYLWSQNKKPSDTITACCLDVNDGNIFWSRILKGTSATSSGVLFGKYYFVSTFSGDIYALNIFNGNIELQENVPETSFGSNLTVNSNNLLTGTGIPSLFSGKPANRGVICFIVEEKQ